VDDDPAFRTLARRLLDDCGLAVVGEADSVATALSTATELEPSAVLVDVGLVTGFKHETFPVLGVPRHRAQICLWSGLGANFSDD